MNKWWIFNTYIWAFCGAGWFWISYILNDPRLLLVTLACFGLTWACAYLAETS